MFRKKTQVRKDTEEIFNIPPYLIKPNPSLSRTEFPDTSLCSLADSIRRYGILQPLAVRLSENGKYELIAGERRLRAAVLLGLAAVPCVLLDENCKYEYLSVVENLQHEKLNIFDEARAIKRLHERTGNELSETARLLSVSEDELKRKLLLTSFSRAEMQAILGLGISEKTAVLFLGVPQCVRYYAIKMCAEKGLCANGVTKLCGLMKNMSEPTVEDLERIIDVHFPSGEEDLRNNNHEQTEKSCGNNEQSREREKSKEAANMRGACEKILLRDLRAFEITLEKSCETLRKAGYTASLAADCGEEETVYTLKVGKQKNGI